ncbi:hypothetical protein ACFQZC_32180 [Streptacidiphilus monticola]
MLGVLELPGGPREFLDAAVETANTELLGTLGVNVLAHPATIAALGRTFDEAVARLRYGTIAVNAWTGLGYLTPTATWGAFPGHTLQDVQSGIGVVHNAVLLDSPNAPSCAARSGPRRGRSCTGSSPSRPGPRGSSPTARRRRPASGLLRSRAAPAGPRCRASSRRRCGGEAEGAGRAGRAGRVLLRSHASVLAACASRLAPRGSRLAARAER